MPRRGDNEAEEVDASAPSEDTTSARAVVDSAEAQENAELPDEDAPADASSPQALPSSPRDDQRDNKPEPRPAQDTKTIAELTAFSFDTAGHRESHQKGTPQSDTESPFETIGAPKPRDAAETSTDDQESPTTESSGERDDATTPEKEASSKADDESSKTVDELSAALPIVAARVSDDVEAVPTIHVVSLRERYAQRRLWDVVDPKANTLYYLEERRLTPGEELESAGHFEPVDPFSDRWIFNPVARAVHEQRVLTLYEAPRGKSLEQWRRDIGREAATATAIIAALTPIAKAIAEMHEKGRVHLHLTPRSIWMDDTEIGFSGVDSLATAPVQRSRFRATVGFSAPEIFGRSRREVGIAADVYSLGAIVYYLIAGVIPPVAPETAFAPAIMPRDFRPGFPVGWAECILKATDPAPDRRHANAGEFLEDLEAGYAHMKARASHDGNLQLVINAETHIGFNKARRSPINQDQVFAAQDRRNKRSLVVVADGVSTATYGSGDIASAFIAERAKQAWQNLLEQETNPVPEHFVMDIIRSANADVVDYVNTKYAPLEVAPSEVMGSTSLVAYIENGVMTLGALGDSRVYLIRKGAMECVTRDHNLFTLSLIEGLGLEEVLLMPHGDALARCLGMFDVDSDGYLAAVDPSVDIYRLRLIPGDYVVLCTDGLFDYAGATYEESEANIRRIVLNEPHPGIACLELILLANRGGGGDNIGVAIVKVLPGGRAS